MSERITREALEARKIDRLLEVTRYENDPEHNELEPLSVSKQTTVNILLSWGGPADGYKLTYDEKGVLVNGIYYFQDWGTYDEINLTDKEAEQVASNYLGDPTNLIM